MTTDRQAVIDEQCQSAVKGSTFVLFRGQYRELPIVEVPFDLPLYRPENGRIITQLEAKLEAEGWQRSAFYQAIEQDWVQQTLHALLLALSRDARGPIYQELAQQAQQTEPLLVTRTGVVVNGNRRMAAMRELLKQEPTAYANFAKLRVAVMPTETTAADIEYVESALQLAPETKLAYTWTNRRLKLRRQRDELKLPTKLILQSYRIADKKALEQELAQLDLAQSYLDDYCHAPGDYASIEDAELLFVALEQTLRTLPKELAPAWRWAGFAMIHARDQSKIKLANYFPFTDARPAYASSQALASLASAQGFSVSEPTSTAVATVDDRLIAVLRDTSAALRLSREITDILDQLRIDANEQEAPKRLLQHVQQARKLAEKLKASQLTEKQKAELGSEFAAMQYHSQRFLENSSNAPAPISPAKRKWRKLREDPYRYCADSRNPLLRAIARYWPGRPS